MSSRGVCRYYSTPRGCTRPDCLFQHVDGGSGHTGTSRGGSYNRGGHRGGAPRSAGPRAPNGVCDFYYNKAFCSRGSDCRFRHESPSQSTSSAAGTPVDTITSFLTPAALARIQGPGTDGFFAASVADMKPSEVNYHLNRFLEDSFRFRFAPDVYGFVALMSNASSGNASWVSYISFSCISSHQHSVQSPEDGQVSTSGSSFRFPSLTLKVAVSEPCRNGTHPSIDVVVPS